MAAHGRHVVSTPGEVRSQIKFRRNDLLLRHDAALRDPHAAERLRRAKAAGLDPGWIVREVPRLPLETENGNLVGPNVLDMVERRMWRFDALPDAAKEGFLQTLPPGARPPKTVWAWSIRDLDTLWPTPETLPCEPPEDGEEPALPDHPFSHGLVSGGEATDATAPQGWVRVSKQSTCQVSEYVYRLAVGVYGGIDEAYGRIAQAAVRAWECDQERALGIWTLVQAAPGRVLIEDDSLGRLRPICSISQEVERSILLEACRWVGIDPTMDIRRSRGRPRKAEQTSDQGRFLRVTLLPDNTVKGVFIADFEDVREGTEFHLLSLHVLVSALGSLRTGGHDADAALLEAWLDSAQPDWRERISGEDAAGGGTDDPYEILGVGRAAPMDEITGAYRRAMKAVHPDVSGGASAWLSRTVSSAYRQIRAERKETVA